MQKVLTV